MDRILKPVMEILIDLISVSLKRFSRPKMAVGRMRVGEGSTVGTFHIGHLKVKIKRDAFDEGYYIDCWVKCGFCDEELLIDPFLREKLSSDDVSEGYKYKIRCRNCSGVILFKKNLLAIEKGLEDQFNNLSY